MCHVLIIEDEPLVAMQLEALLTEVGATSFAFAARADEAVSAALAQRPAVITSDVMLEAGTGPQAVAAIHAKLGPIPVIFVTGTSEACAPSNQFAVIPKPFTRAAIATAFLDIARIPQPTPPRAEERSNPVWCPALVTGTVVNHG